MSMMALEYSRQKQSNPVSKSHVGSAMRSTLTQVTVIIAVSFIWKRCTDMRFAIFTCLVGFHLLPDFTWRAFKDKFGLVEFELKRWSES